MVAVPDLLAHVRKRLDELIGIHTRALISSGPEKHDRIAGHIQALTNFKQDLGTLSRDFMLRDEEPDGEAPASSRVRR